MHTTASGTQPAMSFEAWQVLLDTNYGPTRNLRLTDAPFDGVLQAHALGQSSITRIRSVPMRYRREAIGDTIDHFFLSLSLCEQASVLQDGRQSRQQAGDIVLYDSARPYICDLPQGDDQIVCAVPRALLLAHLPTAEKQLSVTLAGASSLGKLAGSLMLATWQAGAQPPVTGEKLMASLLDVVGTAFDATNGAVPASHQAELLSRAQQFMLARLATHGLGVDEVALAIHVSPRTLNRLFAKEGTTAMRWLWHQRLQACHAALRAGRYRSVSETALSHGFVNLAHFSRVFRQQYGQSPQELMARTA
jgi:AraC-like DNA-binding protein